MPPGLDVEQANEQTHLLAHVANGKKLDSAQQEADAQSIIASYLSKEEQALAGSAVGERLPYNDYTTIDWMHDLVKDSFRLRAIQDKIGIRWKCVRAWDAAQGWVASAIIGILSAVVAFIVDVAEATVSDWKMGYCSHNIFSSRDICCTKRSPLSIMGGKIGEDCPSWHTWSTNYWAAFGIFLGFAMAWGIISCSATMLTKRSLPATAPGLGDAGDNLHDPHDPIISGEPSQGVKGKSIYMSAGSGIPEIKTILSGFVIPHYLDFKVLVVKAFGAIFAVATGMTLGKEGPFVHTSTCVAYLVGMCLPKYRENGRKMRELLSAGCSAGISVAFGAPIGGVLFSYEEISTYFPRKVLWRAFLCSLAAAMTLKALNPTGTGKLALFETNYGTSYHAVHYLFFAILGVAGGIFGGVFCRANFLWSKHFRKYSIIKNHPVFEISLVVLVTVILQYPNPLSREAGDVIFKNLLVDCHGEAMDSWVCLMESKPLPERRKYMSWLVHGVGVKLFLTTITFGCKVPSGIIIPALDAGSFFGRFLGQYISTISPGIFAMVGAGAFLAGVSRMTISLCVIMFELTGELEYVVPNMMAILISKWVADALEKEGVYDLAQTVLGHPFLDADHAMCLVQGANETVEALIPPKQTMQEITLNVPDNGLVSRRVLDTKLEQLKRRGILDAGLVLVQNGMLQGYLAEGELAFGLISLGQVFETEVRVRMLGQAQEAEFDMSTFVDRTPLTIIATAPMEYAVEMFGKLGLRHLCVLEEGSGKLVGLIIKKRVIQYIDTLK